MTNPADVVPASGRSARLAAQFEAAFGRAPTHVAVAPGRVNLIGEHTDYNEGLVLPMALELDTRAAAAPRDDRRLRVRAEDLDESGEATVGQPVPPDWPHWMRLITGAANLVDGQARFSGADLAVSGTVPRGAGLSSSASVAVACAAAFAGLAGADGQPTGLALLAQRAEREFAGVNCGIMDPMVSARAQPGTAMLLDCRTLEIEHIPLPGGEWRFVIADSRESRELAASAYNERRAQCEEAVRLLAREAGEGAGIRSLRDVDTGLLRRCDYCLDGVHARRARHVVTENERVRKAVAALRRGDLGGFGEQMDGSHISLRLDYEVSSAPLDLLTALARQVEGCAGSRLTGAGFGGCTVSLVARDAIGEFCAHVAAGYRRIAGVAPEFYVSAAAGGARVERWTGEEPAP